MGRIIFTDTIGIPSEYHPKPASKSIPDWYKELESYADNEKKPDGKGATTATIKRCMPVFDAISAGYIIYSPCDIFVTQREDGSYYEWSQYELITFHPIHQAPNHPLSNSNEGYPKWSNPWAIKTPKGYSTLFVQPFHRESLFTIMPGIVDTDIYTTPVNFPFVLNDPKFEGLIPAGTPIAQVIPFKRDMWEMKLGGQKEFIEHTQIQTKLQTKFFDRYKSMFRANKEYK
jgi:hypothetical protein